MMSNSARNFGMSSKTCPVVSELSNMYDGQLKGDLKKIGMNAGVLALGMAQGGSTKVASRSILSS